jgi:hypothetical protein
MSETLYKMVDKTSVFCTDSIFAFQIPMNNIFDRLSAVLEMNSHIIYRTE